MSWEDTLKMPNWFSVLKAPPPLPKPSEGKLGYFYDELGPDARARIDLYWEENELPENLKQKRIWATSNPNKMTGAPPMVGKGGLRIAGYDPNNTKDMKTLRGVMGRLRAVERGKSTDRVFPANQLSKDLRNIFNDKMAQDKDWVTEQVRNKIRSFDNKGFKFSSQNIAILRRNDAEPDVSGKRARCL